MGKLNPKLTSSSDMISTVDQFLFHPIIKHNGLYYIEAYLDICYYTCLIPFRIEYLKTQAKYQIHRSAFQKILCILFHLSYNLYCMFCNGYMIVNNNSSESADDPFQFFIIGQSIIEVVYAFTVSYNVFCKFGKFDVLLKSLQEKYVVPPSTTFQKNSLRVGMFAFFWIYSTVIQISEVGIVQEKIADSVISIPFANDMSQGRPSDLFSENPGKEKLLSSLGANWQRGFHLFYAYGRTAFETLAIIFFGFGVYLQDLCEGLRLSIAGGRKNPTEVTRISKILASYLHITDINTCMNSICGQLIFVYIIGSVPFFAKTLKDLGKYDLYFALRMINIMCYFMCSMISSASANAKADTLKDELIRQTVTSSGNHVEGRHPFMTLQIELSNANVGLKGSEFFTVSYQFLGTMMSQCIVYALILLQLKGQETPTHTKEITTEGY